MLRIFKIALRLIDRHILMWQSLEILNVFNTLILNKFSEKLKSFSKNWSTAFLLKVLRVNVQHFHARLQCQNSMLRQIEWELQDESITKNGVLPATTLFFRKFHFSLRALYKEFIWCNKHPNVHVHNFWKRWSFIWRVLFPCEYP